MLRRPVTTVGFIGSGQIGSTVAQLRVAAGHHIIMSNSRGPLNADRSGRWPYGPLSDENGTPASEAIIREALSKASR
jgi:lactate dehydrogenase-like 2-hydroxyacid dehydrogenase